VTATFLALMQMYRRKTKKRAKVISIYCQRQFVVFNNDGKYKTPLIYYKYNGMNSVRIEGTPMIYVCLLFVLLS
jgi:hypothetical protein